jgi:hypothetical protein
MVALLTAAHTTKVELYRCNGIYRWQPEQRWQYESGMNTWSLVHCTIATRN